MAKWFKDLPLSLKNVSDRAKPGLPGAKTLPKVGASRKNSCTDSQSSSVKNRKNSSSEGQGKGGAKEGSRLSREGIQSFLQGKSRKNSRDEVGILRAPKGHSTYINRLIKVDPSLQEKNGRDNQDTEEPDQERGSKEDTVSRDKGASFSIYSISHYCLRWPHCVTAAFYCTI